MDHIKNLWWGVWCVQALLGGVAAGAQMGPVEGVELVILLGVFRAGQIAALRAPCTATATRGVAELGHGARGNSLALRVPKVIWRKYGVRSSNEQNCSTFLSISRFN